MPYQHEAAAHIGRWLQSWTLNESALSWLD